MKTVFGVNSATPINKRLKNGYTMYDWVARQKGFPSFCMRTLCGEEKITAEEIEFLRSKDCKIGLVIRDLIEKSVSGINGTADNLSDAAAGVAAQPAKQRGVGELRGVFEERPHLHAADEAGEEPCRVEPREAEHAAVDEPCHGDRRQRQREFEHRAPRLAALEIPGAPFAAGRRTVGRHARQEVDADEGRRRGRHRTDRGEEGGGSGREAANASVQSLHRSSSV